MAVQPYLSLIWERCRWMISERATFILTIAGACCATLMIVRWISVFRGGPYVFTTGAEQESLFSVWKSMRGDKVYPNPFEPPFAASYYNWLFYWSYGCFASAFRPLQWSSLALPSTARFLTLALTVASGFLVYALLAPLNFVRRIAGSLVIALNPLIGFWSVTVRPDLGALVCDLAGLWCVTKANRSSAIWLMPALAAFYGAWAFKQHFVAGLIASCIYLVASARWKQAFMLGAGAAIAFSVTIACGDAEYRYVLLESQLSSFGFSLLGAVSNCLDAFLKAPLFALGLISILASMRKVPLNLFAIGGAISFALLLPASAKELAASNLFFEPAALCSIAFLLAWSEWRIFAAALAQLFSPVAIFGGLGLILWGPFGALSALPKPQLSLIEPTVRVLPGPVIVTESEANLPWFQKRPPYFVVASSYEFDRRRGKTFAFDGVAGMIRAGLIKVLVCPRADIEKSFDGIVPASFRKIREDSYWSYFDTAASR